MKLLHITAAAIVSTIALAPILIAPAQAADPLGTWLAGDKKGKIRIVNCGGAICGNLVWLAEPNDPATNQPKLDDKNADTGKRSRPLARHSDRAQHEAERRGQMGRAGLQFARRSDLFRFVHHDRRQYRRAQGLRGGRALQVGDLDAFELALAPSPEAAGALRGSAFGRAPQGDGTDIIWPADRTTPPAPSDRGCRPLPRPRRGSRRRV